MSGDASDRSHRHSQAAQPHKPGEQRSALRLQDPPENLRPVGQPTVPDVVPQRADRAGLGLPGTEYQAVHPGRDQGPRTHRAGLHRHRQSAASQPPAVPATGITQPGRPGAQSQQFSVGSGIAGGLPGIAGSGQLDAVAALDYDVAADVLGLLRVDVPDEDAVDADEMWPEGDLGLLADLGLPAEEMQVIIDEVDLYPDEQLDMIAQRCGFRPQLSALLEKQPG